MVEGKCETVRQGSIVIGVRPGVVVAVNKATVSARAPLSFAPKSKAWYSTFASIPSLLFILAFALLVSKGFLSAPLEAAFQAFSRAMNTEPGMMAVYLGIGLTGWVQLCRVVRAETLRLKTRPYVTAARSLGVSDRGIMFRHILPNLMHLVIVYFTMRFASAVMTEVIVSYLGLGVKFEPSWGLMISNGQSLFWRGAWWEIAAATGFMFVLVLALNMTGDALRDALDPRHTSGK